MKPAAFDYHRPGTVEEAVEALVSCGDGAKILAGGQSLIPMMNYRLAAPAALVDISRIPDLDRITVGPAGDRISLGGLVTHQQVVASPDAARHLPLLCRAASMIGHLAIRNRGTVAGSLAHSDPAAEWPLLCRLLDADVAVRGPAGPRTIDGAQLNTGYFQTTLDDHDVVTGVTFSIPVAGTGWGFEELARRHGDFALAMVGTTLRVSDGVVAEARIALGAVDSTPLRAAEAERHLVGQPPTEAAFTDAGECAAESCSPVDDLHASAGYRRHLVGVLTVRALQAAADRAGGGQQNGNHP